MTSGSFEQALELFASLCELPAEDQERALVATTAEVAVVALVRAMLAGDRTPLSELDRNALEHLGLADGPSRIGPYRILERIALGGMGIVYKAEREFPRRVVALKRIGAGFLDAEVRRAFEAEVQTVAQLEHPGIARVYEAGFADEREGSGPYYAMEFVDGGPLTSEAERRGLSAARRLELLTRACEAVHFAHQKGVIHCDLKPDNVLLAADGLPRVLDFGIARVLGARAGEGGAPPARAGGTPGFMCPEQRAGGEPDTSWDVYALGRIGRLLLARSPTDARLRGDAGRYAPDLGAILSKAAAEARAERYDSVAALAADLRRCLEFRPTLARPASGRHRLRLFRRRRPSSFAFLLLLALVTASGVSGVVWQGRKTVLAAEATRLQASKKQAAFEFMKQVFLLAQPESSRGKELTLRETLDRAEELAPRVLAGEPEVLAIVRGLLGSAFGSLGRFEAAERNLTLAHDGLARELGPNAAETLLAGLDLGSVLSLEGRTDAAASLLDSCLGAARAHLGPNHSVTLRAEHELGCALCLGGDWPAAEPHLLRAVEGRASALGELDRDTLASRGMLGYLRGEQGRLEEAQALLEATLAGQRQVLGEDHPETLTTLNNLATVHADAQQFERALALLEEEVALTERVSGPTHPDTLMSRLNLGMVTSSAGEPEMAEECLRAALADIEEVLDPDHPLNFQAHHDLAEALREQGRLAEAEEESRRALDGRRRILGPGHANTLIVLDQFALLLCLRGEVERAAGEYARGLEDMRRFPEAERRYRLTFLDKLASCWIRLERWREAAAVLQEIVDHPQADEREREAARRRSSAVRAHLAAPR